MFDHLFTGRNKIVRDLILDDWAKQLEYIRKIGGIKDEDVKSGVALVPDGWVFHAFSDRWIPPSYYDQPRPWEEKKTD